MIFLTKKESEGLAKLTQGSLFVLVRNDTKSLRDRMRRGAKLKLYQPAMKSEQLEFGLSHWEKITPPNKEAFNYIPAAKADKSYPIRAKLCQTLPLVPDFFEYTGKTFQTIYKDINCKTDFMQHVQAVGQEVGLSSNKPFLILLLKKL
jgi:hypothetical protein